MKMEDFPAVIVIKLSVLKMTLDDTKMVISCKNRHKHSFIDYLGTTEKLTNLQKSTSVIKIVPHAETGEDLFSLESGRF